jgi:GTPase
LRGPGETQLETDRRLIAKRIRTLKARLEKLARQRDTGRHVRREVPVPTVALVGYTNAGKSTLFNALTGSATYVADQLFATLDPTVRQLKLAGVGEVVLADTVGFVRALPHELVAAFRSTLQEARDADLLLHVVDASDPQRDERIEQVREVLRSIGAGDVRELVVLNKIDLAGEKTRMVPGRDGVAALVSASAVTGEGLPELREALAHAVRPNQVRRTLHLELPAAAVRSDLYKRNAVRAERQCEDGSWDLDVELDLAEVPKLLGSKGVNLVETKERTREQRVA